MNYFADKSRSFRDDGEGPELMANFVARIEAEVQIVDGINTQRVLTLAGEMPAESDDADPVKLPPVELTAEQFASMSWVMAAWGSRCVIRPGSSIKDDLRTMIQLNSAPKVSTVYRHTGWTTIRGKPAYLHGGGAITPAGNDTSVQVRMSNELARYSLACAAKPQESIAASLDLTNLDGGELTWPLLAATLAPVYGPCDFAVHVTGRTGSFKSEVASLFQSHYGCGMDARHLPGSWSSTPNALEALAFFAKDALFVVDDFIPAGSSTAQRTYQANADKIIRAQGNQQGRARLTDVSSLQQTMYPRGLILSTGEDTPEGHSVRGRMLILEISPGKIGSQALSAAQALRDRLPGTIAWLAQSLAKNPADIKRRVEQLRTHFREIGHGRTPSMLARLVATVEDFTGRAAAESLISKSDAAGYSRAAAEAIAAAGNRQKSFLEGADPVELFIAALRQLVAGGFGHFRGLSGGIPACAMIVGWTVERMHGELETYKARGPVCGWCKPGAGELYLDAHAGVAAVRKIAGQELSLSGQTLLKRLKEAGKLKRVDSARDRNTVRVMAEGHPRNVLCFDLYQALDVKEVADDGEEPEVDDIPE